VTRVLTTTYGIQPKGSPKRIDSYWDFNFKVATTIGPLFCKAYTHDRFEDARFHTDIMGKLTREGILVPAVVPSRDGKTVTELNGLPCIVQRFLPGESLSNLALTPPMLAELGRTLAQIHNTLEGRIISGNRFKISSWDPRQHQLLFSRYDTAVAKFSPRAQRAIDSLRVQTAEYHPLLREFPVGITHGDYHPGNILVAHQRIAAVLDFNEAIESWLVGDIGIALSYMNNERIPLIACAQHLLAGYRMERALTLIERAAIPLMIQLRAATRVIETTIDGGRESVHDLRLINHLNDPTILKCWLQELLEGSRGRAL
jgi:Ser/Thr protein kinase RdoA (MazF antagonist)